MAVTYQRLLLVTGLLVIYIYGGEKNGRKAKISLSGDAVWFWPLVQFNFSSTSAMESDI